jgi:hypothetical protein
MGDPDHAAASVKKYEHVRGVMKSELVGKDWMQHFWVMDSLAILGKVPAVMEEKLKGLRNCLASDGVHYTDWGYQNWYCSMSNCMARVLSRMSKAREPKDSEEIISGGVYTWRGFSSSRGSTRRPTPTTRPSRGASRGAGRGGGRGGGPSGRGHGRSAHSGKPYDHFGQRRF